MAEFIRVSKVKEHLAECPICHNEYDEVEHLPRRMPCCLQSICHSSLRKIWKNNKLRCPLCRHEHELPEGVASLPVESLMLKILDHLKIQKGLRLPCTDCPDGNEAQSRCDDCSIFLCEECHRAHGRSRSTREHKTVTFDEMKGRPVESFRRLHQCKDHLLTQQFYCRTCKQIICVSCTVVDHDKTKDHDVVSVDEAHKEKANATDDVLMKLDQKVAILEQKVKHLDEKKNNIEISQQEAKDNVNRTFDSLVKLLETRRASLLFDVDVRSENQHKVTGEALDLSATLLAKVKSSTEYTRNMRERADKVEDLQLMVSTTDTLNTMLQETAQDVNFDRTGVTFAPVQVTEMQGLIDVLGSVRTVTFTPAKRPPHVQAGSLYNAVSLTPEEHPKVSGFNQIFSDGAREIISPYLEFDLTTASADVQVSSGVISNIGPHPAPQDTGCRLQSGRHALTLQPIPLGRGKLAVFSTRMNFILKQQTEENTVLWGAALTSSPVDSNLNQHTGLSLWISKCCQNHKLCLQVWYDDKLISDNPISSHQVSFERIASLGIVIDKDATKIHILDVNNVNVVRTISDVSFDRPPWLLMYVGPPSSAEMTSELISGQKLMKIPGIKQLISSLK